MRIFRRMREDKSPAFPQAFAEEMGHTLDELPAGKEEREAFLAAICCQGFADAQMQLRNLERALEELKHVRDAVSGELKAKCRMAVGLGGMGGLLLVILLI